MNKTALPKGDGMMNVFEVLAPGLYTTVQDLGRPGYGKFGVPDGGALDKFALSAANLLVGNDAGAAGLEVTQAGLVLRVLASTIVVVTGADLGLQVNGLDASPWCVHRVKRGDILHFARRRYGVRAYVAVPGGFDVPVVMGSRSTYVRGGFGGYAGRTLRKGDVLKTPGPLAPMSGKSGSWEERVGLCLPAYLRRFGPPRPVRVVAGPQADGFAPLAWRRLLGAPYVVTPAADRMGYRLSGPALPYARFPNPPGEGSGSGDSSAPFAEHVSDGIAPGSIQVPGDGQPIVLLADRQTTGGYPKIATVISADMDFLAHVWPGEPVAFRLVDVEEAHRIRADRRGRLKEVARFAQGL